MQHTCLPSFRATLLLERLEERNEPSTRFDIPLCCARVIDSSKYSSEFVSWREIRTTWLGIRISWNIVPALFIPVYEEENSAMGGKKAKEKL